MAVSMKKMRERLAQLESEYTRIGALVEHYRLVIADLEVIEDDDTAYSHSSNMRDSMEQILRSEARPLHYREIYNRLVASGVRVNGEDPVRNTGAHLSSDDRFQSLGSGMWGMTGWSAAPGAHPEFSLNRELEEGVLTSNANAAGVSLYYEDLPDDGDDLPF